MGQTVIEKIITNHSKDNVIPGKIVWMDLDVRTARDFGGANVVKNLQKYYPGESVNDTSKTFFTFDCVVPANNIPYANNQHLCRQFAAQQKFKLFDVNAGIGSHVAIDKGIATPGSTMVGTDSHLNILGAIGCFGQGMGDQDIAFAFKTGRTWFEVPHSMKIIVKGNYSFPTTAKDLALKMLATIGSKGALGLSAEYVGEAIDKLTLSDRITLASQATEMGAIITFITPNAAILKQLKGSENFDVSSITADKDAKYLKTVEVDIQGLEPMIACPYSPSNVKQVREVAGRKVDSVLIGSCTNGRFEDFELAAKLLKGKTIASHVMAKAIPSTREVFKKMMDTGVMQSLFESGFIISNPGCGGCASGQIGMTGHGEVQISTSNRNFKGKQGNGDTYLAGPAVVAASALTGKITDPRDI